MRIIGSFAAASGAAGLLALVAAYGWVAPASAQSLVSQAVIQPSASINIWGAGCEWVWGVASVMGRVTDIGTMRKRCLNDLTRPFLLSISTPFLRLRQSRVLRNVRRHQQ